MADSHWSVTGNAEITDATDFVGTTDSQPLVFKTNGIEAMRITPGFRSVDLGGAELVLPGNVDVVGSLGIGIAVPDARLQVAGVAKVQVLEITGGADVAEDFSVESEEAIEPGTVMVIDDAHPGKLGVSERPYDQKVAGIVAGANGLQSGVALKSPMGGQSIRLALTGRAYCKAEALQDAIRPGDLLTTSVVRGHATRVTDKERAAGAILGKAMTPLSNGFGCVLVLVNLQ